MVSKILKICTFLFLIVLNPLGNEQAAAQASISFYTDVTPKAGGSDESFIFSVIIENATSQVTPFLIGGDDFEVRLLGPRSSTTIINGKVSSEIAYNYRLTPKHEGLLSTPSAEVEIDGKKYTANALQVKVSKSFRPAPANDDQSVFLRQETETVNVYLGEQLIQNLNLYSSLPLYEPQFSDATYDGFWSEDIGDATRSVSTQNGKRYNLFKWRKALYATRTGQIEISPRKLDAKIRQNRRSGAFPFGDPFDDPFDSILGATQFEERTYSSNPLKIEVKPLPEPPAGFEGWNAQSVLVGKTDLSLKQPPANCKTGESQTFELTIQSFGNLQPFTEIPIKSSEDFRIYKDLAEDKKSEINGKLLMQKSMRFSIVPLKPGEIRLPPIKLGYFDAESATYKTAESAPIFLNVSGSDLRAKDSQRGETEKAASQPTTNAAISTPSPIVTERTAEYVEISQLRKAISYLSLSALIMILCALALLFIIGFFMYKSYRKRLPLRALVKEINNASNFSELSDAFRHLLCLKCEISSENTFGDALRASLKRKLPNSDMLFKVQTALDSLDSALYSKQTLSPDFSAVKSQILQITSEWHS